MIAPMMCNIFLSTIDRPLHDGFIHARNDRVPNVFRYIDDLLFLFNSKCWNFYEVKCVDHDVKNLGNGLTITNYERPIGRPLDFLDLRLNFNEIQAWWMHVHRASS